MEHLGVEPRSAVVPRAVFHGVETSHAPSHTYPHQDLNLGPPGCGPGAPPTELHERTYTYPTWELNPAHPGYKPGSINRVDRRVRPRMGIVSGENLLRSPGQLFSPSRSAGARMETHRPVALRVRERASSGTHAPNHLAGLHALPVGLEPTTLRVTTACAYRFAPWENDQLA